MAGLQQSLVQGFVGQATSKLIFQTKSAYKIGLLQQCLTWPTHP